MNSPQQRKSIQAAIIIRIIVVYAPDHGATQVWHINILGFLSDRSNVIISYPLLPFACIWILLDIIISNSPAASSQCFTNLNRKGTKFVWKIRSSLVAYRMDYSMDYLKEAHVASLARVFAGYTSSNDLGTDSILLSITQRKCSTIQCNADYQFRRSGASANPFLHCTRNAEIFWFIRGWIKGGVLTRDPVPAAVKIVCHQVNEVQISNVGNNEDKQTRNIWKINYSLLIQCWYIVRWFDERLRCPHSRC